MAQAREQRVERADAAQQPAGGAALRVALDRDAVQLRRLRVVQAQRFDAAAVEQGVVVQVLHVGRMRGRCPVQVGARGRAALAELARMPRSDHRDPMILRTLCGVPRQPVQRVRQAGRVVPVGFERIGLAAADGVDVRVDEARYHRAALQVQLARGRTDVRRHFAVPAHRHDALALDRQRRGARRRGIHGDDLAVAQHQVGVAAVGGAGQRRCQREDERCGYFHV